MDESSSKPLPVTSAHGGTPLEPPRPRSRDIIRPYRQLQTAVRKGLPGFIIAEIEPTSRCGAACRFCPREALARPRGDITPQTAAALADNLAHTPPIAVLLSGFGEPTHHPDLPGIVRSLAQRVPCPVGVVTNGARLSPELAHELVEAGAGFFHVSVPAATPETAAAVAPGLDFISTTRHLEALLNRWGKHLPVAVNFVVTEANRSEKAAVCRTWRSRGAVAVYTAHEHNRGGFLRPPDTETERRDCWIYRSTLFVTWQGRVLTCCHDLTGEGRFGDLTRDSVQDVLKRKEAHVSEVLARALCRRCDFYLADA